MSVALTPIDPTGDDHDALISFFSSQEFPYHANVDGWSSETVRKRIGAGYFFDAENESFWLDHDGLGRIGFVRLEDLRDDTPMFDLRLAEQFRGRGLGVQAVEAIARHLFSTTQALRLEGQTREDNHAMRSVFDRAGWTQEAHYRHSWPASDESRRDSVAYAILREEWEDGSTPGVHWHDRSYFRPYGHAGIIYTSNVLPASRELLDLYDSVGWSAYTEDPARLRRSLQGSAHIVCARSDGELVGLARVISDFGTLVYLQDVLVDPRCHRRGIGAALIHRVLEPFSDIRQTVLLTEADPGLAAFYTSLGFSEASPSAESSLRAFVRM